MTFAKITWPFKVAYSVSRDEIANVIESLLQTESLLVQFADIAWKVLATYGTGAANFADCLIERIRAAQDCATT